MVLGQIPKYQLKHKHIDLPFYLAFATGIYLFEINNKNRKALYCGTIIVS